MDSRGTVPERNGMGLIDALNERNGFTDTENTIADYLLAHKETAGRLDLKELSAQTYSSNATIVRFCRKLGCDGFKDFRVRFVAEVEKQRSEKRDVNFNFPFAAGEDVGDIMKSTSELMKEAVDVCYESLERDKMVQAARAIRNAANVYIYGIGDSYISALAFANQISKLGIVSVLPMQFQESVSVTSNAGPDDVALLVSYSGNLLKLFSTEMGLLKRNRCTTILISSLPRASNIDILIHYPPKEQGIDKISVYYSQTASNYVLNCLYGMIYAMDYDRNRSSKLEKESIRRRNVRE